MQVAIRHPPQQTIEFLMFIWQISSSCMFSYCLNTSFNVSVHVYVTTGATICLFASLLRTFLRALKIHFSIFHYKMYNYLLAQSCTLISPTSYFMFFSSHISISYIL